MAEEMVDTWSLGEPFDAAPTPMNRKEFYRLEREHFRLHRRPSRAVGIVQVFLITEYGDLILQKRSWGKAHNPGLFDKTMGGHVTSGRQPRFVVMSETFEELEVSSVVLTASEWADEFPNLRPNVARMALIREVGAEPCEMRRVFKTAGGSEEAIIASRATLYFGVYGGAIRFVDREVAGMLQISLEELEADLRVRPEVYTNDLHYWIGRHGAALREFIQQVKTR